MTVSNGRNDSNLHFRLIHSVLSAHDRSYSKVILMACEPVLWSEIKNDHRLR